MPPRLQCLDAVRNAAPIPSLRMRFSTSRIASAELPADSGTSDSDSDALRGLVSLVDVVEKRQALRDEQLRKQQAFNRANPQSAAQEQASYTTRAELTAQIHRRWRAGDVYAPHDLTGLEMAKWKKRGKVTTDVFDVVAFNPIAMGSYKNFSIMSEYVTPMGRIRGSKETGLRPVNQRKIAKAIRRSIGLGIMPSVHRHPEILYKAKEKARDNDNYASGSQY
ncbi:hypothetical protein DSL72_006716 [Monilinia vaccinii-corymbosi]|uniref:Small ribosomal subunit protein bS18m n=1 Tax=Monilinia vaccinii-corymbosi TaxID=61207 RepID=A0A8A3PP89_9HELO|nr:hypothetical protein DSL72_006716 [Monilinia vaccinii-corymbosi]